MANNIKHWTETNLPRAFNKNTSSIHFTMGLDGAKRLLGYNEYIAKIIDKRDSTAKLWSRRPSSDLSTVIKQTNFSTIFFFFGFVFWYSLWKLSFASKEIFRLRMNRPMRLLRVFDIYALLSHACYQFYKKKKEECFIQTFAIFLYLQQELWEKLHTMRRLFTGTHVIIKKGIWKYFWNDFYFLALKLRLTFVNTRYFTSQLLYCWMKAIFAQKLSSTFNLWIHCEYFIKILIHNLKIKSERRNIITMLRSV